VLASIHGSPGRAAHDLIDARLTDWRKNIENLEHRLARKEDATAREKVAQMKERLPVLEERSRMALEVPDAAWPDYKSETDLILESLIWLQSTAIRRLA
jgi:hypothetical protein